VPERESVVITRDAAAMMLTVGEEMVNVLGWSPEQLVGIPSTEFIHPEDQPSAIVAWFQMIETSGESHSWQGRYRTPQGEWRWVECVNVNDLEDPDHPVVVTTMKQVTVDKFSLAEELRARKQLLSRLSDAAATFDAHFSCIETDDQPLLDGALQTVFRDEAVDDVELRFVQSIEGKLLKRVCVLSMRPLTDDLGFVSGAVGCVADVTEQVLLRQQLEIRANVDELTSCLSRSAILKIISTALEQEQDRAGSIALVFVDLCGFKEANDVFGYAAGDMVLQVAGARLRNVVREGDHVG
jgi:PAS domain S-box-containing protein